MHVRNSGQGMYITYPPPGTAHSCFETQKTCVHQNVFLKLCYASALLTQKLGGKVSRPLCHGRLASKIDKIVARS